MSFLSHAENLEPIIQSEVIQKEKDKHHIIRHIYGIKKKMVLIIYLQGNNGEIDLENRFTDMGTGKEKVRCIESVTWKLTLPYVK